MALSLLPVLGQGSGHHLPQAPRAAQCESCCVLLCGDRPGKAGCMKSDPHWYHIGSEVGCQQDKEVISAATTL